ncbi:MAG: T9SS type A sorting domain-containing protein [Ginsengibacter sp.]
MKKLLPVLFCIIFLQSNARTWDVNVENFQFDPSTLNVVVGDVIHFIWVNGGHTASSSSVPAGAATWDAPMNVLHTTFDYTVAIAGTYNYFCKIHGAAVMSGSFVATGVTPVTLSAFNISTQGNSPLLSWTTQAEINTDYFSVRKSINGIDFKEIGKVTATGNSAVKRNYSFSDEAIVPGINYMYYVLATVDKDGKTQLSPIKIYKNRKALPKLIISLSPNPISDMGHLMLQFNADKTGIMIARLIDMQGKVVLKTELSAEKGVNNGHIHLGNVPAGIYTINFSLDGISESYRVVKD